MKKFLSLVMALVMILSCAAALADNLKEVYVGDNVAFKVESDTKSASQSTDIWLQVEANGQIDATIPLVAVFKTNIDGGSNTISNKYTMKNNSSAALKVTKVVVTDKNADVSSNGVTANMKLVETLAGGTTYDEYTLTMLPADHYATKKWAAAKNIVKDFTASGKVYTLDSVADGKYTEKPGLWRIEKKTGSSAAESYINLTLATSKLDFVTKQYTNDKNTVENGVQIVTIQYTVMIDDSTAVGGDIEGKYNATTSWSETVPPTPVNTDVPYEFTHATK